MEKEYDYSELDCDPSGEGCKYCPRYMDDCDGKDEPEKELDKQGLR